MKTYRDLVKRAQEILADYTADHEGNDPAQTLLELVALFDGPDQRAVEASPQLTLNEFQDSALRTCSPEGYQHFFKFDGPPWDHGEKRSLFNRNVGLLHALTKISEEAGEMWGPVNKAMWYGRELGPAELANIKEEAGDLLWYLAGPLCRALGCTLEEIAAGNVAKLRKRYPEKYTDAAAVARADKVPGDLSKPLPQVADMKPPAVTAGMRLRVIESEDERNLIRKNYGPGVALIDFSDGYVWNDEDRCWEICPELWEPIPQN